MGQKTLWISEIFYSIQGESSFAGYPCIFIRTAGCPLRCVYCDTSYAFHSGYTLSIHDIVQFIKRYPVRLVEITGGEPLVQKHVIELIDTLINENYTVLLETSGAFPIREVPHRAIKIVDVKCPDSGAFPSFYFPNFTWLMPWDQLKFVVRTSRDVRWALEFIRAHELHRNWTVFLSPAHGVMDPHEVVRALLDSGLPVRLQIQLHKYLRLSERDEFDRREKKDIMEKNP